VALTMSAGCDRHAGDASLDQRPIALEVASQAPGSILIIGDDVLLVRALDRLLRKAGYAVGTEDRWAGESGQARPGATGKKPELTIIDLPDHHVLDAAALGVSLDRVPEARILWIGTTPTGPDSSSFLVKPFTAEEFLSRVKILLATQN